MEYVITSYGTKLTAYADTDPFTFNLFKDCMDKVRKADATVDQTFADILEVLYYGAEAGFYASDDVVMAPLLGEVQEANAIVLLIPSPALVLEHDAQTAGRMLEELSHTPLHIYTLTDEEFEDMYTSLTTDPETSDDDETDAEPEDVLTDAQTNATTANPTQYIHTDKLRKCYKLSRASDIFKYKKAAKAIWSLGDYFFLEPKEGIIMPDVTATLQDVDTTYAKRIPLNRIRIK
ncbi:hypothetical protein [Butyrivibrio sp.]|uniref:hypothetical protein n=1 Tax=Butyrivibrio sp. TaxID=28121 RepID=UPI0025C2D07F|nr:hypothetical protein [Butyrivibrio sp.]MBQ9302337.1 hypothetical protein [Butyrivibrio sp.]